MMIGTANQQQDRAPDHRFECRCRECGQRYLVDERWKMRPIATCKACGKLFRIESPPAVVPPLSILARLIKRLSGQPAAL
jgi:hypothetical protein